MSVTIAIVSGNNVQGEYFRRLCSSQRRLAYFELAERSFPCEVNVDSYIFSFSEKRFFRKYILERRPTHIVSFVDEAPSGGKIDKNMLWERNVGVNEAIAKAANLVNAHVTLISNEFLFDGQSGPYSELDKPSPPDFYGKTRHAAENAVLSICTKAAVLRAPFVYGYSRYLPTELNGILDNRVVSLRDDYYSTPVYAEDLALAILKIISASRTGIFCAGGADYLTPYEWGLRLNTYFCNINSNILPAYVFCSKEGGKKLKYGFVNLKTEVNLQLKFMGISSAHSAIRSLLDRRKYNI